MDTREIFANRLNLAIEESGLLAKQICTACGIAPSSLSNYRKGLRECGIDSLVAIANCLNVSPDYLLGYSDAPYDGNQNKLLSQCLGLDESSIDTLRTMKADDNSSDSSVSATTAISTIISYKDYSKLANAYAEYFANVETTSEIKAERNAESSFRDDERVPPDTLSDILSNNIEYDSNLDECMDKQKKSLKNALFLLRRILLECGYARGKAIYEERYDSLCDAIDSDIQDAANLLTADWDDLE